MSLTGFNLHRRRAAEKKAEAPKPKVEAPVVEEAPKPSKKKTKKKAS